MTGDTGSVYLEHALPAVDRLLSNLDRNRDSPTYGCFCRPYWHDKVLDFPSAHQQIGVLPLAIVYGNSLEENPYEGDERIEEWCRAGIRYWEEIQRHNGSFDEHYPREYSLGAAAWTLWAVTEAVKHLDNPPDIAGPVHRTVNFMQRYDEPGDITNHQAVAAAALVNADDIVDVPIELITDRLDTIESRQSDEGGFQEYRGADPGYQSTSIAHLARIWEEHPDLVDEEMLHDALTFFSHFIDTENYYGSRIGSRNTQHVHPSGFEILADRFDTAATIASCLRGHIRQRRVLLPATADDKHFSWHQAEFLLAHLSADSLDSASHTVESRRLQDFLIRTGADNSTFINLSRGGYVKRYQNGRLVAERSGVTTRINGTIYTANRMGATNEVIRRDDTLRLRGRLRRTPRTHLTWMRHLLLRGFQHTFGRLPQISLRMKEGLIDRLITGGTSSHEFERDIALDTGETEDRCDGEIIHGKTRSMFIPNSEYFQYADMPERWE